ncbi:MAG: hypothetical protein R3B82_24930 [Sandaracinaceae bacterium]
MTDPRRHYCPRCEEPVRAIEPWRGWKPLWNVWKVGFALMIVGFPVLASDYCVMLPSCMLYLAGGGLLRGYAREKPVCRRCSLELDEGVAGGTTIRPRPRA